MSTHSDTIDIEKMTVLQLSCTGDMPIIELTARLNALCEQADSAEHPIVILQLTAHVVDIFPWPGQVNIQDVNRWERAIRRLERLPAVTIILVSGVIGGAALDLILTADYRIVTTDFQLHLPLNHGHIWPGTALYRLVNQVGMARSRQLLMGVRDIGAQRALDIGLVDEVAGSTSPEILEIVSRFAAMSGAEVAVRRQLLLEVQAMSIDDAFGLHLAACDRELNRLHVDEPLEAGESQ